jgi:hypothetical protein
MGSSWAFDQFRCLNPAQGDNFQEERSLELVFGAELGSYWGGDERVEELSRGDDGMLTSLEAVTLEDVCARRTDPALD